MVTVVYIIILALIVGRWGLGTSSRPDACAYIRKRIAEISDRVRMRIPKTGVLVAVQPVVHASSLKNEFSACDLVSIQLEGSTNRCQAQSTPCCASWLVELAE